MLLDAYGTLLRLPPPAPRLRALLAAEGHVHPEARVAAAVAAEVRYYRRHHDRGRDAPSLAALRRDCAAVIAAELGGDAPPAGRLAEMLVDSLRFELMPDALPALAALAARRARLAVVSNWDYDLPRVLAGLGVAGRFAAVVTSAAAGAAKPDPAIFLRALARLGVAPADAVHCGDSPHYDCAGARAAGIEAVLIDRGGATPPGPCRRIATLVELARVIDP
ncbi:MAG TPA: HAD family hydrolase [Miltoncostaeaceae bacterium]|nr:HAD family hydrolase [Miltoncostaeaceae bacterium]